MLRDIAADLLAKYVEMARLRTTRSDVAPRLEMALLARRFPGALREIDEIPLAEIERRIAHLTDVLDGTPPERWVVVSHRYHALLRIALDVKANRIAADAWGEATADDVRRPRSGRLSLVVIERLARELDASTAELRAILFPFARRRNR